MNLQLSLETADSADEDCYGEWSDWSSCVPFHPLAQLHHQQQQAQHKQTFRIATQLSRISTPEEPAVAERANTSGRSINTASLEAAPGERTRKKEKSSTLPSRADAAAGAGDDTGSEKRAPVPGVAPLPGPGDRYDIPFYSDGSPAARCYKTRVFQVYIEQNGRGRHCRETKGATHFAACSDEECADTLSGMNHMQSILDILRQREAGQQREHGGDGRLSVAQANSTSYENLLGLWDEEVTGEETVTGEQLTEQDEAQLPDSQERESMLPQVAARTAQHLLTSGICPGRWSTWSDCGPDCYSRR